MKTKPNIGVALIFAALLLAGCSRDENAPKTFSPEVMQKHAGFKDLYAKTGGDWSKLSPSEQSQFATDWTHGSVDQAKIFWEQEGKDETDSSALPPPPTGK
jgi:hypothetical protein